MIEFTVDEEGTQHWYQNGELHKTDGPAVVYTDGTQLWFLNGERHRTDGPAEIYADGTQRWFLHGEAHRTDGPAIIADYGYLWFLNGEHYEFEDWLEAIGVDEATKTLLRLKWSDHE